MYKIYDLGTWNTNDEAHADRKIAEFNDKNKAIEYVEHMGQFGERYGVFNNDGKRVDNE